MVEIIKIHWLSQEAEEAEIHLFDGNFNIVCFSHPFHQIIGDNITSPLYTLNANNIFLLCNEEKFSVEKNGAAFEYKLSGKVLDKSKSQIKIGEFIIELDIPLPLDIDIDNYISFTCDRIDL